MTTPVQPNVTSKIINAKDQFENRKCPVGSMAWHTERGDVEIIAADGDQRTILYCDFVPGAVQEMAGESDMSVQALFASETIVGGAEDVDVKDLVEMNFARDINVPSIGVVTVLRP